MGEAFVFYVLLTLTTLSLKSCTGAVLPHDDFVRCAESCLKLIPPNSSRTLDHDDDPNPQMVKHCAKLTPDGKCECDWEKILTDVGDCECRNPLKTIDTNNQCVCDYAKCKPPMKNCKLTVPANDENCTCAEYQCWTSDEEAEDEDEDDVCPEGSYRSNQTQDGGCLCYPCKSVTCKEGQNAVVVRKGTNKPGTCCDLYQCDDLYAKKTCEKDGRNYADGESWTQDDCTIFRCENGILFQELKDDCVSTHPCFFKDLVYAHGDSWFEDECTNCTCINGKKKCMAHFCKDLPAVTIPPKTLECPYMGGCRKKCAFGYRLNRQGCEICKCRQPDAKTTQEILRAVNCTPESCDVIHLLPSNCSSWKNISAGDCAKTADQLSSILSVFLVIVSCVCIFLIVVVIYQCRQSHGQKRPQSASSSEYVPFKSKWDANSNTEKPVLCKNAESNSYGF